MKIKAEINKMDTKRAIQRIKEFFFCKNKQDWQTISWWDRRLKFIKLRDEKREATIDSNDIHRIISV